MKHKIAKKILKIEKDKLLSEHESNMDWELITALDIAIETLEEKPQGEWIHRRVIAKDRSFDMVVCSNCREEFSWDAETGVCMDNYKTCPNCGADMKGG